MKSAEGGVNYLSFELYAGDSAEIDIRTVEEILNDE